MVQFEELAGLRLSQLKDCKIEGADGEPIGRLIDAAFTNEEDGVILTKFIVGGSRFEELMERLKIKADVDPVFSTDVIESVSPRKITLTVSKDELKSTHIHHDAISENEVKLSDLGKLKVVDSDQAEIGKIIDLKFEDNSFKFILGETKVKEWAEAVGLITDVDFLIEPTYVSSVSSQGVISLKKRKDELKSTFERYISDQQGLRKAKADSLSEASRGNVFFPSTYT